MYFLLRYVFFLALLAENCAKWKGVTLIPNVLKQDTWGGVKYICLNRYNKVIYIPPYSTFIVSKWGTK